MAANVSIVKYMLAVERMDRAVEFYANVFDASVTEYGEHWSEVSVKNAMLGLHGGADDALRETSIIFVVQDIHLAAAAISKAGGTVVRPAEVRSEEGITIATCADTERNCFSLVQQS